MRVDRHRLHRLVPGLPALLLLVLGACDSLTGPGDRRELGVLARLDDGTPEVTVPDTVEAGEAFVISVVTTWPNTCASLDETEVRATTSRVDVIPWDRITGGDDEGCGQAIQRIEHSVTLSRNSPATLSVVIHGRESRDGPSTTVVRELVVRGSLP